MKIKSLLLMLLLAVLFGAVMPRQAEARVTFSFFYDSLQPYGDWVDVDNYGYCWQPRGLDTDWRPYTDGYWTYTDAGWTWVSYEDFGSITYHYGRWIRLEEFGWVWQPGYQWGPAWVSWRTSDDYIGWAPLPPEADFNPDTGIGAWVDQDYDIGPSAYSFCEYRYFGAPVMRNCIIPRRRNVIIINSTVNITNITFVNGAGNNRYVFNGGLDYRRISARSERRIEMLQLMRQTDGDWARHHRSELARRVGDQLYINAPEIEVPQKRFAPSSVARQIHRPHIDKGWIDVSDKAERERIKQRYHDQIRGAARVAAPVDLNQVQTMMSEGRARQEHEQLKRFQQKQHQVLEKQQEQQVEQIRKTAEVNVQTARAQQEIAQRQAQAQEKVQRQAQEVAQRQAEAVQNQQKDAIRAQQELAERQAQAQQKVQRQAQEVAQRQAEAIQNQQKETIRAQQEIAQRQAQAQQKAQRQAQEVAQRQAEVVRDQQKQAARAQLELAQRQAQAQEKVQRQAQELAQRQAEAVRDQQKQAARVQLELAQRQAQLAQPGSSPNSDDRRKKKHKDD